MWTTSLLWTCLSSAFQSCDDNIQNQDETDIDCGGMKCAKCEDAHTCKGNSDCMSDVCRNNTCIRKCDRWL